MFTPQAVYSIHSVIGKRSKVFVWAGVFRERFCAEVQHTSKHKGHLVIFDGQNNFRLIHEEPVELHYDGDIIDQNDIEAWEQTVKFVLTNNHYQLKS